MKTTSYRNKHIITLIFVVYLILQQFFQLEGLLEFLGLVVYGGLFSLFFGSGVFEKKDELTKEILSKATEITFYITLGAMFIIAIILMNIDSAVLGADLCFYSVLGSVAVRSIIFLWLDRTPKEEGEE